MREHQDYSDLTDLFTAEDRKLDGKPFVADVMSGIRRKTMFRRIVLAGVGVAGAGVAAMQLPKLLTGWTGLDGVVTKTITDARADAGLLTTVDPLWMMIGGMVVLTLLAVTTMERA